MTVPGNSDNDEESDEEEASEALVVSSAPKPPVGPPPFTARRGKGKAPIARRTKRPVSLSLEDLRDELRMRAERKQSLEAFRKKNPTLGTLQAVKKRISELQAIASTFEAVDELDAQYDPTTCAEIIQLLSPPKK